MRLPLDLFRFADPHRPRRGATRLRHISLISLSSLSVLALALSGCAVGPDFKTPAPLASSSSYTPTPLPAQTEQAPGRDGAAQRFVVGGDIPAQWWGVFQSPELDQLVRKAIANSPNIASAQAALLQAQETYRAQQGALLVPNVNGGVSAERERASAVSTGVPNGQMLSLYNASVNVSYTVDVFGANKRLLEGQQTQVNAQNFQLEAAYLTLTGNVVTAAIREASLRAQLQATKDLLKAQIDQLELVQKQFNVGAISEAPVLQQRNTVAQSRANIPPLELALAQTRHLLSVLVGQLPSEAGIPEFNLDALQLPHELPLSVPSELARQRPDIRAAEEQLHYAAAQVGVATANLYPQLNLTGSAGFVTTKLGNMFSPAWDFWSLTAGLTAPIFNGGALQARKRAAEAGLEHAAQQYRATVLQAFRNVADSLRALEQDANALKEQAEVESTARQSLQLAEKQYQSGSINFLNLLDAQRSYQQARIGLVAARAARYADTAALFQSLGGGWWNRGPLPQATPIALKNNP